MLTQLLADEILTNRTLYSSLKFGTNRDTDAMLANMTEVAPYIKAAVRDMKAYSASKKYRNIPIGYSHADISSLRPTFQDYLACGNNASESIDCKIHYQGVKIASN